MYRINKHSALINHPNPIFHTQDLAVLWGISNPNTLYTTIKRYCQRHVLYPVYKGMYSRLPVEKLDPLLLGIKAMHRFAYISCETVLSNAGIINQVPSKITIVSSLSKQFTIGQHSYYSRQLKDHFLYNPKGIHEKNGVRIANTERAIVDLLYFNPKAHLDAPVNWKQIKDFQKLNGYPLTKHL